MTPTEDALLFLTQQQREYDKRWAEDVWRRVEEDDETRDHYRSKWEQDR